MKRLIYIICLVMLECFTVKGMQAQGLFFNGQNQSIDKRTSYQVFPKGREPIFKKNLELSFELSIRDFENFGYIFSLQNKNENISYSLTYTYIDGNYGQLKFNTDGRSNHFEKNLKNDHLKKRWLPIIFRFNLKDSKLSLSIDGVETEITNLHLSSPFIPMLYFGRYDYRLDLPSFGIRNLSISGDGNSFFFPLNESKGNIVHDREGNEWGIVQYPHWMINDSYHWKLCYETTFNTPAGITYNERRNEMWLFSQDTISYISMLHKTGNIKKYKSHVPVKLQLGTNFFNTTDDRLYVYELNNLPIGDTTTGSVDISATWKTTGSACLPVQLHHHVGFWHPYRKKYLIFGGFGNKRYNNSFLAYSIQTDSWDTLHMEGYIEPRYFSGLAVANDPNLFYIYGGMGNDSGEQSVGRNYYHDLYLGDLSTMKIKKLWGKSCDTHRVPARNMIISSDEKYIYLLAYPEYLSETNLQLYKLSIKDGTMCALGDSIPMISEEIATNANLYYSKSMQEFYCSILEFSEKGTVHVRIYSLSAPPVSLSAMNAYSETSSLQEWLILVVLSLLVIAILLVNRLRKKQITYSCEEQTSCIEAECAKRNISRNNAIYLFGCFTVYGRNGTNISHLFSPRIRELFIYFLLNSMKDGVASNSLNEIFWADKPDEKVKNLKGVTINQLRKVLAELDGIELVYEKGYFKLIMEDDCFCDYRIFINQTTNKEDSSCDSLMHLLLRGKFLEGEHFAPFDSFKSHVENFLVSYLPLQLNRCLKKMDYNRVIKWANILLLADPLNETAISFLVYALAKKGDSDEAMLRYSSFAKEYRKNLNEDFPFQYGQLIDTVPSY